MSAHVRYRWRRRRVWLTLIGYWFICTAGAGAIARLGANQSAEGAWVILVMLVLVTICMVAERGHWEIWKRVAAVPAAWLAQAVLQAPSLIVVGMPCCHGSAGCRRTNDWPGREPVGCHLRDETVAPVRYSRT